MLQYHKCRVPAIWMILQTIVLFLIYKIGSFIEKSLNIKPQCPTYSYLFKIINFYPYTKFQDYRFCRLKFKKSLPRAYFKKSIRTTLQCPIAYKNSLISLSNVRGPIHIPNFKIKDFADCISIVSLIPHSTVRWSIQFEY